MGARRLIAYLDTSALLKLYLEETGSERVRDLTGRAALCTHAIAWVEVHAGLAMAQRMGRISDFQRRRHLHAFESDWAALEVVRVQDSLVRRAGMLASQFSLRAYDSVHLAAAERMAIAVDSMDFVFVAFDVALNRASAALGMTLWAHE